ncbi:MAG TPA: hypothetical protein VHV32_01170 [Candidatus Angelobacter sp.]|jgi:tellurite resistance protein|nr:hypothetical protein [Candidatus Angelobacter sp.]
MPQRMVLNHELRRHGRAKAQREWRCLVEFRVGQARTGGRMTAQELLRPTFRALAMQTFKRFTVDRLISIINRLGSRVEVKVRVWRAEATRHKATA